MIIGGGATGTGIARDLSLRGIRCILIEMQDLNNGATGANHGLLHSGARYVAKDRDAAAECHEENMILKKMAPQCIEETGGIFAAVRGDNENYIADFPGMCQKANLPLKALSVDEAREKEPVLSGDTIAAYEVMDATIDPFRLSLDNTADARNHGAQILRFTQLLEFILENHTIKAAKVRNNQTGKTYTIEAREYVNAAGAWADQIAARAGAQIGIMYAKGSLLVTSDRMNHRVINRLRKAGDGDILVPGGTVSIIGTTSVEINDLSQIRPTVAEVDQIIKEGTCMVPQLAFTRYIRAYAGVRPLVSTGKEGGRSVSRNYSLLEHEDTGLDNFITIAGGKLTTFRLMAEKTCDLVAARLKVDAPCRTATTPLPKSTDGTWTPPGKSARRWMQAQDPKETLLCECEMVSTSMVDTIVEQIRKEGKPVSLTEIGLRSRIGKGPCQGTFCSLRVASYLYDQNIFSKDNGIAQIKAFVNERWKGLRPLIRDTELIQTELQEAFLCGLMGVENTPAKGKI